MISKVVSDIVTLRVNRLSTGEQIIKKAHLQFIYTRYSVLLFWNIFTGMKPQSCNKVLIAHIF